VLVLSLQKPSAAEESQVWSGELTLGYNQASGNTEKASLNISGSAKRMFSLADLLIKGDVYSASTNGQLDDQKWNIEGSFAYAMTPYRSGKEDDKTAVFVAHTYLEKKSLTMQGFLRTYHSFPLFRMKGHASTLQPNSLIPSPSH